MYKFQLDLYIVVNLYIIILMQSNFLGYPVMAYLSSEDDIINI